MPELKQEAKRAVDHTAEELVEKIMILLRHILHVLSVLSSRFPALTGDVAKTLEEIQQQTSATTKPHLKP